LATGPYLETLFESFRKTRRVQLQKLREVVMYFSKKLLKYRTGSRNAAIGCKFACKCEFWYELAPVRYDDFPKMTYLSMERVLAYAAGLVQAIRQLQCRVFVNEGPLEKSH
jgi:hypothetical protein